MRSPSCLRVGALLARRTEGLSESERLVIEDHVAGCSDCRDEARWLAGIVTLARDTGASVGPSTLDRMLRRAVETAGATAEPATPAPRARRRVALGLALAGAAAAALLWIVSYPDERTGTAASEAARGVDRIEAGRLHAGGETFSPGGAVPDGRRLVATAGTRLALAHALVTTDDAEIVWHAGRARLALIAGRVRVSVDPARQRAFAVETPAFSAEVVGTEFEVDLRGVRVASGVVRVVAADGAVLVAALAAGQSWSLGSGPAPDVDTSPPPREPPPGYESAPADPPPASHRAPAAPSRPAPSADEWLGRARAHLAARRIHEARRAVTAALDARPAPRAEAEARTLLAECAQAEGSHAEAARLYRVVAERHRDLPAGENALFAAARAEARAGQASEARALYRTYLERYPAGRFAGEVEKRLRKPDAP
jgi:hypothetical protein